MIPDHPVIREMENKGYVGEEPTIIGECEYCEWEITDKFEAYESSEGMLICGDIHCLVNHAMNDLKEIN
ncbi:hypothetical protein EPH95_02880 [Salicibibacter halophilus]|uniref:Uncharacterized protein n=1 Tax=Salicibibacter halophilus TaxID=2502791 RepID=A0A514LEG4_9BACI|nr:hypothetical protein [Salicibibacter halophilus]QDI90246.1 hypothetical protein EPH95_02880 [Salicibibacter halophilus]